MFIGRSRNTDRDTKTGVKGYFKTKKRRGKGRKISSQNNYSYLLANYFLPSLLTLIRSLGTCSISFSHGSLRLMIVPKMGMH